MINFFAKTNFRNQERVFGIKKDDRRRHMYVIGKTGMGKSNMLENMAIQDIRAGYGVCFVDPHGEGAEKLLRAVPANRVNDVVYFNPADKEFPVAFNILESVDEDKKNLVASGMMGVFKKIWPDVWSPRMEYILNNTILALLDYPGSTMLGVNRMMSDKDFRKRIYPKIKDPVVKSFWINEFDQWEDKFRKEAVAAIQNKVGQFLSSFVIRHIVGQPKSTIDMRDIMDNQKILIVNLSKGRIGEDAMHLLGGMIVTKIQLAAMGRVDIPEAERKDFYLYVDEFQNFATESFANILSEARKYRLCLTLAHQYINQLIFDGNSTVRDAIFGNVGTIVSFRVGAEDAEHLEKEYEPVFVMNDIVNLSKYNMYLKLMIDGIAGDAFSATALPPVDISDTAENEEKAIRVSRERYGKSRAEVEDRIARWSGMFDFEEAPDRGAANVSSNTVKSNSARGTFASREDKENSLVKPAIKEIKNNNRNIINQRVILPKASSVPSYQKPVGNFSVTAQKTEKAPLNLLKNNSVPSGAKENDKNNESEKKMFEAVCDTCEEKIFIPFKPDPNRPTFCRECLKDYQRARARAQQNDSVARGSVGTSVPSNGKEYTRGVDASDSRKENLEETKEYKSPAFVSPERPITFSQIKHMSPQKFKPQKRNVKINLEEVRKLISNSKNNG